MHTNRNAIVYGLSAGSGLPGHIRFSRSEYRYSMLWFSLVIGFLQKNYGSRSKKGEIPRFELSHNALNRKPQK